MNKLEDLKQKLVMGPLRFELKLPTPQAGRIPSYPTVPHENGRISSMRSA